MRILVTGASGFVGSLLVPKLCTEGHAVRALGRDPARVARALAHTHQGEPTHGERPPADAQIVRGDVLEDEGLQAALEDVEVAYYLIHAMERTPGESSHFAERDATAAEHFAAAARRAGVRRIVYLGGLVPRLSAQAPPHDTHARQRVSRHLASREHVERILLSAIADSLALRASIVIGARSRSFRLLVHLVERMPVLTLPAWHTFRTQPIDARDVITMLAACAATQLSGRSLDIGGPDALTYGEMLKAIAGLMLVNRPTISLGLNMTGISARVAAAIASEDPELVVALMEGLNGDLLPADDRAADLLGTKLHSFQSAVEHALADWEAVEPLAAR
ncbi:MAG TPA: NAD-dependent epimerase/dehydratase family protein [Solirubrobacteraceae bacterium]|nr:NAD-dependent epimerase/dehydratase family protein [Solirubrobacteraceae bacterium]